MKLVTVSENHKLGSDEQWDRIRAEVVKLLDKRDIKLTSVDLVCFAWSEEIDEQGGMQGERLDEEDQDLDYDDIAPIKPVVNGTVYSQPTIWIGVIPNTLTGELAHHSANDILELLKNHDVTDVEVAFRESEAKFLAGPELFGPVSDLDPLKDVIDNLSTALSLPISGLETTMEGTLGFYFRDGDELYAVTARHALFKDSELNDEYNYVDGPKKEAVVMGPKAFHNYLNSIQRHIGALIDTANYLEKRATTLKRRVDFGGDDSKKSSGELAVTHGELDKLAAKIGALKQYFVMVKTKWGMLRNRIIGHVVWAPPIGVATSPHLFMSDFCVIKLVHDKFKDIRNNVLSLGPELSPAKFESLMHDNLDKSHEFEYPEEGLLKLQGVLSNEEIRKPENLSYDGSHPLCAVIKRGSKTLTTVGNLSTYSSHVRQYSVTGEINSTELAIFPNPHDITSGPFSRGGDSGSVIVDAHGRFVALLTSGTGITNSSDITYGTPMFWLWSVILKKFPGASLHWDGD